MNWSTLLSLARAHTRPLWWGILNFTPDSFSDGGLHNAPAAAAAHARALVAAGADTLDIGAESTRPGYAPVPVAEELRRFRAIFDALRPLAATVPFSIDTRKARVMRATADAWGPVAVNDVAGLANPALCAFAASHPDSPVVLMHGMAHRLRPGDPSPAATVRDWFARRLEALSRNGISSDRVILDPGIGFGTTRPQDAALLDAIPLFAALGCPVAIGLSRKRVVRELLAHPGESLDTASARLSLDAFRNGASLLRLHAMPSA